MLYGVIALELFVCIVRSRILLDSAAKACRLIILITRRQHGYCCGSAVFGFFYMGVGTCTMPMFMMPPVVCSCLLFGAGPVVVIVVSLL